MVKVGFICEGETEKLIIDSSASKLLFAKLNIDVIRTINAEGNGNLLPHNIEKFIAILEDLGVEKIIILTDLDTDACITITKNRIGARENDIVIIAVKAIEAWFLSDSSTLSDLFKTKFQFGLPEDEADPYTTLNNLFVQYTGRGNGNKENGKLKTARRLLNNGFNIENANAHPNCNSAKYFVQKLSSL